MTRWCHFALLALGFGALGERDDGALLQIGEKHKSQDRPYRSQSRLPRNISMRMACRRTTSSHSWSHTLKAVELLRFSASFSYSPPCFARSGAVIFYNLFIRSEKDIPRVREIVHEQLNLVMDPLDQEIRINSIGALKNLSGLKLSKDLEKSTKLLAHYDEGFEDLTLHDLWSFCKGTDPQQFVVYLHSKGSFHSWKGRNGRQRYYVTSGALSQECMHMPKQCNVCSSRMTPVPHPHTPGNMWAARCGYIAKLIDPKDFRKLMNSTALASHGPPWCIGRERFSNEHWVNSHPDCAPCDLDTNQSYVVGPAPSSTFDKKLEKAPRFAMSQYTMRSKKCDSETGRSLAERLSEYRYLYSRDPDEDWWGWRHFLQNSSSSAKST